MRNWFGHLVLVARGIVTTESWGGWGRGKNARGLCYKQFFAAGCDSAGGWDPSITQLIPESSHCSEYSWSPSSNTLGVKPQISSFCNVSLARTPCNRRKDQVPLANVVAVPVRRVLIMEVGKSAVGMDDEVRYPLHGACLVGLACFRPHEGEDRALWRVALPGACASWAFPRTPKLLFSPCLATAGCCRNICCNSFGDVRWAAMTSTSMRPLQLCASRSMCPSLRMMSPRRRGSETPRLPE